MNLKQKIDRYLEKKIKTVLVEVLKEKNHNIKEGLQNLALADTCNWIQKNVPISLMFEDRFDLLNESLKHVEIPNGLFLEFGVYKGETINFIAKNIDAKITIYGFDSFEGLNEAWIFNKNGGFSDINGKLPNVKNNVKLIKGYFEKTLPDFIRKNSTTVSFIHIDSDLYSSAVNIFENLHSLIKPGTVIVFDEFFNYPNWRDGEFKAWMEYVDNYSITYDYIGFTYQKTNERKSGNQLAVKIIAKGV
jgi:hypothetical protein